MKQMPNIERKCLKLYTVHVYGPEKKIEFQIVLWTSSSQILLVLGKS